MTFREARQARGLTVRYVAEQLHCSDVAVYMWELGRNIPSAPRLLKLARLYDVSIDELLRDSVPGGAA